MGVKKVATPRNLKTGGKMVPSPKELGHRNIENRVEIEIVGMSRNPGVDPPGEVLLGGIGTWGLG